VEAVVMTKILGIDLGTNSIGYGIRDPFILGNQIIDYGVLTFNKGVGEGKTGEFPLVQERTKNRGIRRNYQARKYRKWSLLQELIQHTPPLCPLTIEELDCWRKYRKDQPRKFPQSKEFLAWLKLDFNGDNTPDFKSPFELRKIASLQKIENPFILGRVLYNLVQRRGFKGKDESEAKTIMEGATINGVPIKGASELQRLMEENNTTVGGVLYKLNSELGERTKRYFSLRSFYEKELITICEVQQIPTQSSFYEKIHKCILWQRPLRSQKGNVGICTFERKEFIDPKTSKKITTGRQRCAISNPLFEVFRAHAFINTIKIKDNNQSERKLSQEEHDLLFSTIFLKNSKPIKFEKIAKKLNVDKQHINYNLDQSVITCPITSKLMKMFASDDLFTLRVPSNTSKGYYDIFDIWHILTNFDDQEKLIEFALNKLHFDEETATEFSKISIPKGYSGISLNAIKKILPFLEVGHVYSDAVFLANLPQVIGHKLSTNEQEAFLTGLNEHLEHFQQELLIAKVVNTLISKHLNLEDNEKYGSFPEYILSSRDKQDIISELISLFGNKTWLELESSQRDQILNKVSELYGNYLKIPPTRDKSLLFLNPPRKEEYIFRYLQKPPWNISEEKIKFLYHPSEIESFLPAHVQNSFPVLGDPIPVSKGFKNPMALKTLFMLKKLINHLLLKGKINPDTKVIVEIARELNDSNKRKAIQMYQREREKENLKFKAEIEEHCREQNLTININDQLIDKYRLWTEQNRMCIYTGRVISISEILNGTGFDLEHTIPASMSFDNELKNLTLCDNFYNRAVKRKRIPTECENYNKEINISGTIYPPIRANIKFIEDNVAKYLNHVKFWSNNSKQATTKEQKDNCILHRHYHSMHLDYWRKKLDSFTITEYKASWRNSQLRDTQIITKYAVPYLKTVFHKVEVQKGAVTAAFREIYNVQFKKDRTSHTHHAIDAAVLTLIPSHVKRDELLAKYFEKLELKQSFHAQPPGWDGFERRFIKEIENTVLVNFYNRNRVLVQSKKIIRKRGKIQYVKQKDESGALVYKLSPEGNRIPMIAQGTTIRGRLHKETFSAAIKTNNGEINYVVKVPFDSTSFTELSDLNSIVDSQLKNHIVQVITDRIDKQNISFLQAISQPIWMKGKDGKEKKVDKNGFPIQPIRHIRCYQKAGRGFLKNAVQVREQDFVSKNEIKRFVYAQNDENALCLFYRHENPTYNQFRFITLLELAKMKLDRISNLLTAYPHLHEVIINKKKQEITIALHSIIQTGTRILVFNNDSTELFDLWPGELSKRLFVVYKFNAAPSNYLYAKLHTVAKLDDEKEYTEIDSNQPQKYLKLTAPNTKCLFEGIDFNISLDGTISFLNNNRFI
jgi:CRISPR-associated endonuclease Csn1